jgi:alpha-galactosidase
MGRSRIVSRRRFLKGSALAGASALTIFPAAKSAGSQRQTPVSTFFDLVRPPDFITAYENAGAIPLGRANEVWRAAGITLKLNRTSPRGMSITISAPTHPVSRLHLRWQSRVSERLRFLGDHWERSYGDLEWRGLIGERVMPWYFMVHDGRITHGYGVQTAPKALAFWRVDNSGISLWLDVRNGGSPVQLGERSLDACTIVTREGREGESAWQAAHEFCALMCRSPRMPTIPVYGGNNWYYAYGENCSAKAIERDAGLLSDLVGSALNRPFQVIDDGWQLVTSAQDCCSGGPWRYGNAGFPDMPGLASRLKTMGVRPGIWMRPLLTHERGTEGLALKRPQAPGKQGYLLDPTIPEVRERIRNDVAGLVAWGYELVKHDFSTNDLLGRWGPRMGGSITDDGWAFSDRSRTTAEVVLDLYKTIRAGAGERTILIGCNTMGHLAAGLFELQRIGDDTSGKQFDRTRRMGVNSLAFRGPQHGKFFAVDADCVGMTSAISWGSNRQWLDLLSRSGTPFFVSAAPDAIGAEQRKALREAFARAAVVQPLAEPLDLLETTTPEHWRFGKETADYDWYGEKGIEAVESR